MYDHNRTISQVSLSQSAFTMTGSNFMMKHGKANGFQSVRATLQTSRNARHDAQPVRGVTYRHCQGQSQHTVRDRRIVEECNLASANNGIAMQSVMPHLSRVERPSGFDPHGEAVNLNREEKSEDDSVG